MRIIAGRCKGRTIIAPKGMDTRPTLDRVKESVFGILQFELAGKAVLDLFAGSGGMGLEAISRYAASAVFCDKSKDSEAAVIQNAEKLGLKDCIRFIRSDYEAALSRLCSEGASFDVVFLDPPYASGILTDAIRRLESSGLLNKDYVISAEYSPLAPPEIPDTMIADKVRRYGEVEIMIIRESRQ